MEQQFVTQLFALILIFALFDFGATDITQDKEKCTNQLIGLATCLTYVAGDGKTPTTDCCKAISEVIVKSKECVCILIKDRDDPGLGIKVNISRVFTLPIKCHSSDPNLSECPTLLHLPKNSSDAKVFDDFAKTLKGMNSNSNSTAANAKGNSADTTKGSSINEKSEGPRTSLARSEMALGLLVAVFFTSIVINNNALVFI